MHRLTNPLRCLTGTALAAGALSLGSACLNGCTTVAGSSPATLVRVIDASKNAPAMDAYVATVPIALNFVSPSVSNYAFLGPGAATVNLDPHNSKTPLKQLSGTFAAASQYSIYVTDQGTTYNAALLTDQSSAAPSGDVSFRFLQQANVTGAVDVYLIPNGSTIADAKPLLAAVAPGTVTPYINVTADTYVIAVAPAGTAVTTTTTTTTSPIYMSAATQFSSGQVSTVLILDEQLLNSPPVTILLANDAN
ncbi:MAG TPA: DUF4397 domain-containing protein [Terracidiphilus sp.]|jgi:hypothetical protein|nr:DUF4397 domain-containing protein [Terracidiphilus sp.]